MLDHLRILNNRLDLEKRGGRLVFAEAEGFRLKDMQARAIDAMSGLWVVNLGHERKELAQVAADQMSRVA